MHWATHPGQFCCLVSPLAPCLLKTSLYVGFLSTAEYHRQWVKPEYHRQWVKPHCLWASWVQQILTQQILSFSKCNWNLKMICLLLCSSLCEVTCWCDWLHKAVELDVPLSHMWGFRRILTLFLHNKRNWEITVCACLKKAGQTITSKSFYIKVYLFPIPSLYSSLFKYLHIVLKCLHCFCNGLGWAHC